MAGLRWRPRRGLLLGWRGLGRFWLAVLVVLGVGGGALQVIGPPSGTRQAGLPPSPQAAAAHAVAPSIKLEPIRKAASGKADAGSQAPVSRALPGPVTDPDPALLEPDGKMFLPRVGSDGRTPMREYAAAFDPTSRRPRVGVLVAGVGMSEADSLGAVRLLPGAVTLAVSPYATNLDRLLGVARMAEHEYLLSIPMEPQGYPANDPDDRHALMTSLPPPENLARLHWALSRVSGYVGVTNALGSMHGERLADMEDQFTAVLEDVAERGLLFVDARPGQAIAKIAWSRSVDLVIDDDPLDEATLDKRLEALSKMAKDNGSALGLVSAPRPKTMERLVAWSNTLADRGLVLAPVSALVLPPAAQERGQ